VKFDSRLNEFNIVKGERSIRIYHCPFCGGKAPESLRDTLFAHVSGEERERLHLLGLDVASLAQIVAKFGEPSRDQPLGAGIGVPEPAGEITQFISYRVLTYAQLSKVADLQFHLHADGGLARIVVSAKYIGNVT
jgi:hypothetical protein